MFYSLLHRKSQFTVNDAVAKYLYWDLRKASSDESKMKCLHLLNIPLAECIREMTEDFIMCEEIDFVLLFETDQPAPLLVI